MATISLRTLLPWPWRRRKPAPAVPPAPSRAIPVGRVSVHITPDLAHLEALAKNTSEQPLPVRTPGLSTARGHVWEGVRHGLAAIRDADACASARLDPARLAEEPVRRVAALHQLDAALESLAAARRALDAIEGSER